LRVLLIDDHALVRKGLEELLQSRGIEVVGSAGNGEQGIQLAKEQSPDIILLDINLPGIDGLELARRFKADERLAPVPLVATTAQVLVGDRERCLEAGCDDYLPKPLDIRKLRQVIRHYLSDVE